MKAGSLFLGLCASIGCTGLVHAQVGVGETNVTWQGTVSVVTTCGITYAQYTWGIAGCEVLRQSYDSIGPVIRNGSNFWFNFDIEAANGVGVACPELAFLESTNAVLGALAPGTYTLTTTSWGVPVATNTFTIPTNSTPSTPILLPIGFGTDGSFQIQLNGGVTNVSYVLQCSTNFVNWTSVSTNSVGPPLRDTCPVLPGPCYYRVQILQQ